MRYSFLVLSLLFALPGVIAVYLRADLRPAIRRTAVLSLPFALTEFLFYPRYWEPEFLFDLVNIIGFGVEDLLFVAGLGALCVSAYPLVFQKDIREGSAFLSRSTAARIATLILPTAVAVVVAALLSIPMIYAAPVIMLAGAAWIWIRRNDLILPSLIGSILVTLVYAMLSLVLMWLVPGVFQLDWNTSEFLNLFVLGIPVEELLYGASAGLIGSVFYPYTTDARLVDRA